MMIDQRRGSTPGRVEHADERASDREHDERQHEEAGARDLPQDADDRAITEAIITMGKSLNLTVVAEGVETLEQETFLREHACDETQGFYFSRPIASDEFAALLRRRLDASK